MIIIIFLFSFFPHLARALSRFFVFNIQIVRKQYDVICNVISYKFKCTTVKIAFTTEDDIRMSKHVLQTKSCGFFIKNFLNLFKMLIKKRITNLFIELIFSL